MPSPSHVARVALLFLVTAAAAAAAAFAPPPSLAPIHRAISSAARSAHERRSSAVVVLRAAGDTDTTTTEKEQQRREPWDVLRFVRQSSRFVRPPNPFRRRPSGDPVSVRPGDVIWSAGGAGAGGAGAGTQIPKFTWAPLDDVVMGGVSNSEFDNETGRWVGTVSSTNSGGFVGIRTTPFDGPALDLSACRGIELRTRDGDGKRFKAVLRDSTEFNGVCWTSSFDAPRGKNGGVVRLPFDKQVPTIFARTVPDRTFGRDNVVGFQLAYSKFEYDGELNKNFALGDFALQLLEVRAY